MVDSVENGMEIDFAILGPLEVRRFGKLIDINGARQKKLLALFLLNVNSAVTVSWLIDELWQEPPRSVRQQIHNAVAGLRRTLTDDGALKIATTDTGYTFETPRRRIDVHDFRARVGKAESLESQGRLDEAIAELRAAYALWRGGVLLGLDTPFLAAAATNLEEQRIGALEYLLGLRLLAGESGVVVNDLRALVAEHPLRESLRYNLMVALYKGGRQAEALAVFADGRAELAEQLGIDPAAQLRSLHTDILQGARDVGVLINGEVKGPNRSDVVRVSPPDRERPTQCYLPNDTRDFYGRSSELNELSELLLEDRSSSPSALSISAIGGMGGIGKTTLAVHLAHGVLHDYPDGQFFVDLHGFTLGVDPLAPAEVLDTLLRDSGVPTELVPPTVEGRMARWRSHMAGKRAIVVLDNAANASQVRPLLPGTAGILVIITSRRRLTALDGVTAIYLDVLPHDEAVEVFRRVAGKERTAAESEAVAAVARLCGHLPLALRIAGARLRERPAWSVADLVLRLENQARRGRFLELEGCNVMDVLQVSYRYLRPAVQRVFRLLGLHPGADFDKYAAAALTGLPVDEAEDILESLLDDSLLRQDTPDRYYFHDLVRDCAHDLCTQFDSDQDRATAQRLLLDYYVHVTYLRTAPLLRAVDVPRQVDRPAFVLEDEKSADPTELLDRDFGNIVSAVQLAIDNGLNLHAHQITCVIQPYLRSRNYNGNARRLCELGVTAARADGDDLAESICLQGLAAFHRERGSANEARANVEKALKIARAIDNDALLVHQLMNLGVLHANDDQLHDAFAVYLEAEEIAIRLANKYVIFAIKNNLGALTRDLGRFDSSLVHLQVALDLADTGTDATLPLWNIALTTHLRGSHRDADDIYSRILARGVQADFKYGEALALAGLAATRRSLGEFQTALDHGRKSLALARRFAFRRVECDALSAVGEAWVSLAQPDSAAEVFEQAMNYAREYSFPRFAARALEGLAHVALLRGETEVAERHWRSALEAYPIDMYERSFARDHLASLSRGEAGTCFRCRTADVVTQTSL